MSIWSDITTALSDTGKFVERDEVIGLGAITGAGVAVYKGARIVAAKMSTTVEAAGDAVGGEASEGLLAVGVDAEIAADVGAVVAASTEAGIVMVEL